MKKYQDLGQLLRDFREVSGKSRASMAQWIGVDERSVRRWEKKQSPVRDSNIKDIAKNTKIPFEVLFRLNHQYPTLYDISTHRYASCPFDKDYVNRRVLRKELFDTEEQGNLSSINLTNDIEEISSGLPAYLGRGTINTEALHCAIKILPELNLIIRDPVGFYSGHLICFPLRMAKYDDLKSMKLDETKITIKDMTAPPWDGPIALHIYSLLATCSTYVYCIMKRMIRYFLLKMPNNLHPDTILSRYAVTEDGNELCKKIGMKVVNFGYKDLNRFGTEALPHFYEIKISELEWLENYKDKI